MRYVIAALLGAIVVFLWGFIAHMLLPIGEMGMRKPTNEDAGLQVVASVLLQQDIYLLLHVDDKISARTLISKVLLKSVFDG